LTWQALHSQLFERLLLDADQHLHMHADLQAVPMQLKVTVTVRRSSKAHSLMAGPTSACFLKSCKDSGMKS